MKWLKYVTHTW